MRRLKPIFETRVLVKATLRQPRCKETLSEEIVGREGKVRLHTDSGLVVTSANGLCQFVMGCEGCKLGEPVLGIHGPCLRIDGRLLYEQPRHFSEHLSLALSCTRSV